MRIFTRVANVLGPISLVASFALASPGVTVMQAEPPLAATAGAECLAEDEAARGRAADVDDCRAEMGEAHAGR